MRGKKNNNPFTFKQFEVLHHLCAHKVGFDGVLLGAWANVSGAKTILDIGTGSGLIALMAAQKNAEAKIHAIECDDHSCLQAGQNFAQSIWSVRLTLKQIDFFDFPVAPFDHIITNPPYFVDALNAPAVSRNNARHFSAGDFKRFMEKATDCMQADGKFSLIVPCTISEQVMALLRNNDQYISRICRVFTANREIPERVLIESTLKRVDVEENDLFVYDAAGEYSAEYIKLTRDFYPQFN